MQGNNSKKEPLELAMDQLSAAKDFYLRARHPEEVDLVKEVRKALFNNGATEEDLVAHYDNNPNVVAAGPLQSHAQQYQLNRFFNDAFMELDAHGIADTRQLRFQLVYNMTPLNWLTVIEQSIAGQYVALYLDQGADRG